MTRILEGKNRASADEAASFVDRIEEIEKEIDTLKGEFMAKCKAKRDEQKEVLDDAKSQGVAKKVVKTLFEIRKLRQKEHAKLSELEGEDHQYGVDILKVLGGFADLPLGAAAVDRERKSKPAGGVDPIAAAADKVWSDADPNKKVPETAH